MCQKRLRLAVKWTSVSPWREVQGLTDEEVGMCDAVCSIPTGRGLQSSTYQLNLSRFGHTSPCPPV